MLVTLSILSLFCFTQVSGENQNKTFNEVNVSTVVGNKTFTRADGPYLVTRDLAIARNATLSVESGTEVWLVPKVAVHVYGTLIAEGTHSQRITFRSISCNETSFCNNTRSLDYYNTGIRLVDGTSHNNGRLELQWNGQWGTICDRYWDYRDTEVACRQLGFLGAKRHYRHSGSGNIWMRNVACRGNENSLWRCSYYGIGNTGCGK